MKKVKNDKSRVSNVRNLISSESYVQNSNMKWEATTQAMAQPTPPEGEVEPPPVGATGGIHNDADDEHKEVLASKFFAGSPTPVSTPQLGSAV